MWTVNPRPTILLVEDEPSLLEALEYTLRRHGYDVIAVGDGHEACGWLAKELPDLAIVDMMIPGASGFTVTGLIKDRSDERVPVIMMSGNTAAAHRDYAFASGADVFLAKPFMPAALMDSIRSLCPARMEPVVRPTTRIGKQLA